MAKKLRKREIFCPWKFLLLKRSNCFFNLLHFFAFTAIYSGDYYLFETSESESDSDEQELPTATGELTLTTPPQQTSEQVTTLQPSDDDDEADAEISMCLLSFC